MAQGDFGQIPNIWRPLEVPPNNIGENTGVGMQGNGGQNVFNTNNTFNSTTLVQKRGWTLIDDFGGSSGGITGGVGVTLNVLTIPAGTSLFAFHVDYTVVESAGANHQLQLTNEAGTQIYLTAQLGAAGADGSDRFEGQWVSVHIAGPFAMNMAVQQWQFYSVMGFTVVSATSAPATAWQDSVGTGAQVNAIAPTITTLRDNYDPIGTSQILNLRYVSNGASFTSMTFNRIRLYGT
jgi:hypothetical protein